MVLTGISIGFTEQFIAYLIIFTDYYTPTNVLLYIVLV
jgi:hypothetical protein